MDVDGLVERVREMKREWKEVGRRPGKVVLCPQDVLEAMKLAPPEGPYGSLPLTLWGLEVVESEFVQPGEFVMLDPRPSLLGVMTSAIEAYGEPEEPKASFERPTAKEI